MKNSKVTDCQIIDIRRYSDSRGYLSVVENRIDIPFDIKRIYYLYLVPEVARGAHAHKQLQQLLIATSGSVDVIMDDGTNKQTFHLDRPWKGLLIPPGLWRDPFLPVSGVISRTSPAAPSSCASLPRNTMPRIISVIMTSF